MLDLSAFESFDGDRDADGLLIPPLWRPIRKKWDAMPFTFREKRSMEHIAELNKPIKPKVHRAPASRFTTDYAIAHGRAQGWKLIQRERYDARTRRHHDLPLGSDAMFESSEGVVFVQGAGQGERSDHRKRFEERGGLERLAKYGSQARFLYLEFARGSKEPIKAEWWHG